MTIDVSPEEAEKLLWAIKAGALEGCGVGDAELRDILTDEQSASTSAQQQGSFSAAVAIEPIKPVGDEQDF